MSESNSNGSSINSYILNNNKSNFKKYISTVHNICIFHLNYFYAEKNLIEF